jgi:hypothetical protein
MAAINANGLTQDQLASVKKIMGPDGEERIDEMLSKSSDNFSIL